jgi:hypothetical protein
MALICIKYLMPLDYVNLLNQMALGAEKKQLRKYRVAAIYFAGLRTVNAINWKAAASFSLACLSVTLI